VSFDSEAYAGFLETCVQARNATRHARIEEERPHLRALPVASDNVLTIMGPSKTESLSGYRLGVAFGAAHLVDRMEKLQAIVSLRAPGYSQADERTLGFREIFFQYVLPNRYLWAIAVANAFCYFVRYGVVNWIPTYLETAKGFSFQQSSLGWSLYEYAAIPGTIACGWISDHWFKSRRAPATMLFMSLTLLAVIAYWLNMHGPLWIDYAALIAIGFLIYGPIMMIGLHSLDLVPKKAAGTAAGFTGFFGYVFGSAIAGTGVGWIAAHWGWGGVFTTMIVCCVLTMACVALTLHARGPVGRTVEASARA